MWNPSSPTLDEIIENIAKVVLRKRAEQENQETALVEVPEEIEVELEIGDARAFYSDKGVDVSKNTSLKRSL